MAFQLPNAQRLFGPSAAALAELGFDVADDTTGRLGFARSYVRGSLFLRGGYDLREQAVSLTLGRPVDPHGGFPYSCFVQALDAAEGREVRDLSGWGPGVIWLPQVDEAALVLAATIEPRVQAVQRIAPSSKPLCPRPYNPPLQADRYDDVKGSGD